MLENSAFSVALPWVAIAAGFAVVTLWARARWKTLKGELSFEDEKDPWFDGHAAAVDPERVARILRFTRNWLATRQAPEAESALAALAAIQESGPSAAAVEALFVEALASADTASLLVRTGQVHSYFLVVPCRYENAATLRRHPAFTSGWCEHLAALRNMIGNGADLIVFAFFLDPDDGESALLLSFADRTRMRVPISLLDARATRTETVESLDMTMEFQLAA